MRESQVLEELEMFGSSQWGLVTAAQARGLGVERLWLSRMSSRGMLQRIRHGVYAFPSAQYGPLQDLQAAWLATDASLSAEDRLEAKDPVVVSHVSAASVHQLGDLLAARHEFSSPARRQTTQKDLRFHRCEVPARDITWVDGLPVTSVAWTVGDLAAHATDADHLATVVRDAVEDHHIKISDLAERLFPHIDAYGAASGAGLVQLLLDQAGYAPERDPSVNKVWDAVSRDVRTHLLGAEWSEMIQASIGSAIGTHLEQLSLGMVQNVDLVHPGVAVQLGLRGVVDEVTGGGMLPPETVQGLAQAAGKIHPDGIERALAGLSPLAGQSLTGFHEDIFTARNESQPAEADEAPQEEDDTDHDA